MHRIDNARIVEIIVVDEIKGTGNENDPIRRIVTCWTKDGKKIVEIDDEGQSPFSL